MAHLLPPLSFSFDALEPHIDLQTMQLHHDKHHQAAVDTLNKAIAGSDAADKTIEELMATISSYPVAVRNSGGSHYNHSQFWEILGPGGTQPSVNLSAAVNATFGSLDKLKEKMNATGAAHFGSGWIWLIVKDGKLEVTATPNQDNPLMDVTVLRGTPILGIDVWEHAYYLRYQNHRLEYLTNIWNVINWNQVEQRYKTALETQNIVYEPGKTNA